MKTEQQIRKELIYQEYMDREEMVIRVPYLTELEFYAAVKNGDVDAVKRMCREPFAKKEGLGVLSENALRNLIYHFVITTALIARYCIEGGLEVSAAYGVSDYYIREADHAKSAEDISALHRTMALDYTRRMRDFQKKKVMSLPVLRCMDYIHEHLHVQMTVGMLAEFVGLHPDYLSHLFRKETGQSIVEYIMERKIQTAKNLLIYSTYSIAEIGSTLAFSSQSYFTATFKKKEGITPKAYREQHLQKMEIT